MKWILHASGEAGCVYRIHFCAVPRRVARDVLKWRTLDGSRLQTLRVPCNFFSSPFPLTPCIAVIPSLPLSLSLFIFHPLLSAARSRISRFRPGVHSLLRLSRTRGEGEVEGVLGKSEINRESMVNNRENKRFVTNRRDDIRFSRGSRFVSLSLSLSLLISYSLEQSCQLETDFLLTYLRKRP